MASSAPGPVYEFIEEEGDEEEDCENEKDGDDLLVNYEDLDDMYVDLQPIVGTSNNNKRKHSQKKFIFLLRKEKFK